MFIEFLIHGSTTEYDIKVRIPKSRFGFTHQDPYTCISIFLSRDWDRLCEVLSQMFAWLLGTKAIRA